MCPFETMKLKETTDEIVDVFNTPSLLFGWINSGREFLAQKTLPLRVLEEPSNFTSYPKGVYDIYPVQDNTPLCNMVVLSCLDIDAILKHVTQIMFQRALGVKEFKEWYIDVITSDDELEPGLYPRLHKVFMQIPALEGMVNAIGEVKEALSKEYLIIQKRGLYCGGSNRIAFTGEQVVILHCPK